MIPPSDHRALLGILIEGLNRIRTAVSIDEERQHRRQLAMSLADRSMLLDLAFWLVSEPPFSPDDLNVLRHVEVVRTQNERARDELLAAAEARKPDPH